MQSSYSAFLGEPERKAQMLEPVRARWNARELVPDTSLNWQWDDRRDSLGGALAQTRDRAEFEAKTGIPVNLAMLCEALLAAAATPPDTADAPVGGTPSVLASGMEWLDAIRPGADLAMVVPRFARDCLAMMLAPDFALAPHITPAFRDVGTAILALWDRELAGETVDRREWRSVRQAALDANARETPVFGYPVATLIEAVAWPVQSVAGEFVGQFAYFLVSWLMYLDRAHMTDAEWRDREHMLIGWRAMMTAPRDDSGAMTIDPLDDLPESQRVLSPEHMMATMERTAAVRAAAQESKDAILRDLMDRLLTLIRAA